MINIKYSLSTNISSFIRTLKARRWLNKNKYIYTLSFFDLFRNESKRAQEVKKILERSVSDDKSFIVYLSKFDTYGNYELPNKIFINIKQPLSYVKKTFEHEIKHLEIEKEVIKRNLSHEQKEKLVNLLIEKDTRNRQKNPS